MAKLSNYYNYIIYRVILLNYKFSLNLQLQQVYSARFTKDINGTHLYKNTQLVEVFKNIAKSLNNNYYKY